MIAGLNIWSDFREGKSFSWNNLLAALGMLVFAGILYLFMRLIFKFVIRYTDHSDHES